MIVSLRGVEWEFSPLTHPDDFSDQKIKKGTRAVAKLVLEQIPPPASTEANSLAAKLTSTRKWFFRRKQRLTPNQAEFPSLNEWLSFIRSEEGAKNAGGSISRYALDDEIDQIDFLEESRSMARLFRPLMERMIANARPATASDDDDTNVVITPRIRAGRNLEICCSSSCRNYQGRAKGRFKKMNLSGQRWPI